MCCQNYCDADAAVDDSNNIIVIPQQKYVGVVSADK